MELNTNFLTEEEYYNGLRKEVLDEGIIASILKGAATLLGYSTLTMFAGIGTAMLAKSALSKEGKINNWFKKIFGEKKNLDFDAIKGKSVIKREYDKADDMKEKLADVYTAIDNDDFDEAEKLFKSSKYTENIPAIKAVAIKLTDKLGEPPLFIYPQGNKTYFMCKKILGIRYAKALASSVLAALKQNKSYHKDIEL